MQSNTNQRETWLSVEQTEKISKSCAAKMKAVGMNKLRLSQVNAFISFEIQNLIKTSKLSKQSLKRIKASLAK